jgi:hypothetical protein
VGEPGEFAQLGDVPRRLAGLGRAGDPLELARIDDSNSHAPRLAAQVVTAEACRSRVPSAAVRPKGNALEGRCEDQPFRIRIIG